MGIIVDKNGETTAQEGEIPIFLGYRVRIHKKTKVQTFQIKYSVNGKVLYAGTNAMKGMPLIYAAQSLAGVADLVKDVHIGVVNGTRGDEGGEENSKEEGGSGEKESSIIEKA